MQSPRRWPSLLVLVAACGEIAPPFADAGQGDGPAPDGASVAVPETTLTVTPTALSNQATASFEFTSDQPATFTCRLDAGAAAPCASPYLVSVADGPHLFEVTATTTSGVADPTAATHAWRVDTVAPESAFDQIPAALDNSTTVRFEFHANEPSTFNCVLDGVALACASPRVVAGLTDGTHTFAVLATDLAGNTELAPAVHSWAIDTSTPDTQIAAGPTGVVASSAARFTFASPDAGAGATFACALDGAAFAGCASPRDLVGLAEGAHTFRVRVRDATGNDDPTPAERSWSVDTIAPTASVGSIAVPTRDTTPTFTVATAGEPVTVACRMDSDAFGPCTTSTSHTPAALGDGAHTLEVQVTDAAGNTGAATGTVTVDTIAPTVMIDPRPSPTGDRTPAFTFTTAGNPSAIQCRMDAAAFGPCTSSTAHVPPALVDGTHTFEVQVTDLAGNSGAATAMVAVDTVGPTVTIAPITAPTSDPTPTFAFTTAGGPTSIQCRLDDAAFGACTTTTSHTPATLTDGTHTLEVLVMDSAGNSSTDTEVVTVDTLAPTVTIAPIATPTNDPTPTFAFSTGGAPTSIECRVGNAAFASCTSATGHTSAALADATYAFEVRVIDGAGNTSAATASVTIDTVAPMVTIGTYATPTTDTTPTFPFSADADATSVACRVASGPFGPCTTATSHTASALVGDGTYAFDVRVTDLAGNARTATAAIAIDTTGPDAVIFSGVTDGGLTNDRTPTFGFAADASATAIECRMDAGLYVACPTATSYTSPADLPDGTHAFSLRARDALGNSTIVTRTFTVDGTPPTLTWGNVPPSPFGESVFVYSWTTHGGVVSTDCRPVYRSGTTPPAWEPCNTPRSVTIPGHTGTVTMVFSVRIHDAAGNQTSYTDTFSHFIVQ